MSGTIEAFLLHLFLAENQFVLDWLMICYCAKLCLSEIKKKLN